MKVKVSPAAARSKKETHWRKRQSLLNDFQRPDGEKDCGGKESPGAMAGAPVPFEGRSTLEWPIDKGRSPS